MVRDQRPGKALRSGLLEQRREPSTKCPSIRIVAEDVSSLDPVDHRVLQSSWQVESRGARHGERVVPHEFWWQLKIYQAMDGLNMVRYNLGADSSLSESIKSIRSNMLYRTRA